MWRLVKIRVERSRRHLSPSPCRSSKLARASSSISSHRQQQPKAAAAGSRQPCHWAQLASHFVHGLAPSRVARAIHPRTTIRLRLANIAGWPASISRPRVQVAEAAAPAEMMRTAGTSGAIAIDPRAMDIIIIIALDAEKGAAKAKAKAKVAAATAAAAAVVAVDGVTVIVSTRLSYRIPSASPPRRAGPTRRRTQQPMRRQWMQQRRPWRWRGWTCCWSSGSTILAYARDGPLPLLTVQALASTATSSTSASKPRPSLSVAVVQALAGRRPRGRAMPRQRRRWISRSAAARAAAASAAAAAAAAAVATRAWPPRTRACARMRVSLPALRTPTKMVEPAPAVTWTERSMVSVRCS